MNAATDDLYERIPHVDRDWAAQATTELALREVGGADIGAALLEVESHMAEHGGDVSEVFGAPKVYAASLELPDTAKLSGAEWTRIWAPSLLIFLGTSLLLNAVVRFFGGGGFSVVSVGALAVLIAVAGAVIFRFNLLRVIVGRPVVSGLVLFALIVGVGLLTALVPGPRLDVPPAVAIPGGVIVCGLGIALLYRVRRRAEADGVTFPSG